ncbi:MAG: hypothetical protein IJ064_04570 [Bacteroidaceae bacterium]|nr:hypothetical protein [Bacteroidaceae bacterium]
MKKFYTLFVAVLVAAVAFAQNAFAQNGKEMHQKAVPVPMQMQKVRAAKSQNRAQLPLKRMRRAEGEAATYVKVNTTPENWEGHYLFVYEDGAVALDGSPADVLDATGNTISVTIADGQIASTAATDAASFTIAAVDGGYSLQGAGGLYMGQISDANGLLSSTSTPYVNQLSIDGEGNVVVLSSGGAYLRYNASNGQARFRYYKSGTYTNQKAIQLYKLNGEWTEPEIEVLELVTLPDGLQTEDYAQVMLGYVSGESNWESKTVNQTVQVAIDGADVYIQGLSYWVPGAWVKGVLKDNQVQVPTTYMGEDDYGYENYLIPYTTDGNGGFAETPYMVLDFDAETRVISLNENYFFAESDDATASQGWYDYWESLTLTPGAVVQPEVVEVPEGLETVQYNLEAYDLTFEDGEDENAEQTPVYTPVTRVTRVGFDGTDVYVQGLCSYLPDAWLKGTLSDGKIVLPSGQYYGTYESYFGDFDFYFLGYGENGVEDVRLTVSEDGAVLTAENWMLTNPNAISENPYEILTGAVFYRVSETAGTPAAPSVVKFEDSDEEYDFGAVTLNIPITDVNGNPLVVDKLFYKLYIDEAGAVSEYRFSASLYENLTEDLVEIPYTMNDEWDFYVNGTEVYVYLNSSTLSYDRIGVQSIYRGGEEEHKTDIAWYTIERTENAIHAINGEADTKAPVYNLAGQRVTKPIRGLYIQNGRKVVMVK